MNNVNPTANQLNPPVVLVKTWCLLCKGEDEKISQHSMHMLLDTFGDMRKVVKFMKANNIKV